jgi:hypothetical protein
MRTVNWLKAGPTHTQHIGIHIYAVEQLTQWLIYDKDGELVEGWPLT